MFTDEYFMKEALKQAQIAFQEGEIPVGAVIVAENKIIGKGRNQTELLISDIDI
jgi:tRNA(adenine34) deaminase